MTTPAGLPTNRVIKCPTCRQWRDIDIPECTTCSPKTLMERVAKLEEKVIWLENKIHEHAGMVYGKR
jgi:hypothetical protein